MTQRASIPDKAVVSVVQQLSYHISLRSTDSGSLRCRRHRLILLRSTLKRFHSALPNPWSAVSKPDGDPIVLLRVIQWSSDPVTDGRGHLPAFGDASRRTGAPRRVELLDAQPPKESVRVGFSPSLRVENNPPNSTRIKRNSISEDEQ